MVQPKAAGCTCSEPTSRSFFIELMESEGDREGDRARASERARARESKSERARERASERERERARAREKERERARERPKRVQDQGQQE
jgi:ATP-dependent RNA helicase DDX46/PRP5